MIIIIIIIIIIMIIMIKSFQFDFCGLSMFSYLFIFLINRLRRLKIYLLKGEKSLSAEMEMFLPNRCSSEE